MKKLSKAQQEVVDLMKAGWALCQDRSFRGGYWLQQDGCGRGGKHKRLNANTAFALFQRGLLVSDDPDRWPTTSYRLKKEGE